MRIRTVKPEFWTDECIGELSIPARLFFIALLNYADDEGNFKVRIKQIKIHTFPYDDIDIVPLLKELVNSKLLRLYVVNGDSFCNITNFKKHQKINRPSPPIHPSFTDNSVSSHILLTDNSLGKEGRKEGIGKEKERINNKNNLSYDEVKKLFEDQSCSGFEEFYNKMLALNWSNKEGNRIENQVSYVLQCIEGLKNGKTEPSNDSRRTSGNGYTLAKNLTGAEQRRLQK